MDNYVRNMVERMAAARTREEGSDNSSEPTERPQSGPASSETATRTMHRADLARLMRLMAQGRPFTRHSSARAMTSESHSTISSSDDEEAPAKIELPKELPHSWLEIEQLSSQAAMKIYRSFGPLALILFYRLKELDLIGDLSTDDLKSPEAFVEPILEKVQKLIKQVQDQEHPGLRKSYLGVLKKLVSLIPPKKELLVGIKQMKSSERVIYKCVLDILDSYIQVVRYSGLLECKEYHEQFLPIKLAFYQSLTDEEIIEMNDSLGNLDAGIDIVELEESKKEYITDIERKLLQSKNKVAGCSTQQFYL